MVEFPNKIATAIEKFRFKEALNELMRLSSLGNKYLADNEPWKLIKTDEGRVKTILNIALQIAGTLSIVSEPFLPESANKLREMLNVNSLSWDNTNIKLAAQINPAVLLFDKIEDDIVEAQLNKLIAAKKLAEAQKQVVLPQKDLVNFEDFQKMDIRIGKIIEAKKVPKTKKLLELKIDTGIDQRTVVSGIAEYYSPEEVIGKQVSILVNLAPRLIKDITSEGMILMAENADGTLSFVSPDKVIIPGGTVN
jgi:methionyl-tRNA synthetase